MPRGRRALLRRQESDDEFETPAFRDIEGKKEKIEEEVGSDSEDDSEFSDTKEESSDEESDADLELETAGDAAAASSDDESDDAPEDIGFKESRNTALSQMRDVMKQLKEEKQQLKAKRKQKDEKFKEQKKMKLERITRLSEDILNKLPEEINKPKIEQKDKTKKKGKKNKLKEEQDITETETRNTHIVMEETEDYLPLETGVVNSETGIKAVSLKDLTKKMAVSQSAANFRNSRLYGDKRQRESTKSYLAKMKKRKFMQR